VAGGVNEEDEDDEDDVHNDRMDVAGEERGLEPARERVHDDAERDEEAGGVDVDALERVRHGGAAEQQHGRDDDVGHEAEHQEHGVRRSPPPCADDLADRVRIGRLALDLDGHDAEQEHLDGGAAGVPERPAHVVLPRHVRALQDGCCPCPLHTIGCVIIHYYIHSLAPFQLLVYMRLKLKTGESREMSKCQESENVPGRR